MCYVVILHNIHYLMVHKTEILPRDECCVASFYKVYSHLEIIQTCLIKKAPKETFELLGELYLLEYILEAPRTYTRIKPPVYR